MRCRWRFRRRRSPRKYWTRKGIAEWLVERLAEDVPTLVGIDHGFSFPLRYFEAHGLLPDWPRFLDDFQRHWPTDEDHTYVDFVRDGIRGNGAARMGNARWRRLTEERAGGAKSVFHFDVQGSVAKSTHAGIPWLRFIRQRLGARVHFWPFDGWDIPAGRSAIAEVYPALWCAQLRQRGPHRRPARRLQHRRLAFPRRPRRQPCGVPESRSVAARTHAGAGGGLDSRRSRLDPSADRSESAKGRGASGRATAGAEKAGSRITKACPECGHAFRGGTWGGIDAHWKALHNDIMPYEDAWPIIKVGGKPSTRRRGQLSDP